jgi:hypothetical protein
VGYWKSHSQADRPLHGTGSESALTNYLWIDHQTTNLETDMYINRDLFSHWAPGALDETIHHAERFLAVHDGNMPKALAAIAKLAGGNLSLRYRAQFGAIERVIQSALAEHEKVKEVTERRCFAAISRAPNDASKLI